MDINYQNKEAIRKWFNKIKEESICIRELSSPTHKPDNIDTLGELILYFDYIISNKVEFKGYTVMDIISIQSVLKNINDFIGLDNIKQSIVNHVIYYLQGLNDANDYLHMVIYGSPGTGKTELAKHIGKLFVKLGHLKKGTFTKVVRADLIAGFLGQTAIKTQKVFHENLGGVLFIDEAYSLANKDKSDSFSKECVDTLCELLSNHKNEIMVILAGYEDEIRSGLFRINSGIESRFQWKYSISSYSYEELMKMFVHKIKKNEWEHKLNEKELRVIFDKHYKDFEHFGRDMDLLFTHVKIQHSRRIFLNNSEKKMIVMDDFVNGMKCFMANKNDKKTDDRQNYSMYI